MKTPIPDDWEEADGYAVAFFCVPNSVQWRAVARGAIYELTRGRQWDENTGSIIDTQTIAKEIYESLCMANCNDVLSEFKKLTAAITGQVVTVEENGIDVDYDFSEIGLGPRVDALSSQFQTDNWVSPNQNVTDVLANALYGRYPDYIPNPLDGVGVADILDEQIDVLHKRFRMDDASIFNLFDGEKNVTETLETLFRTDKLSDLEFLTPNITTIMKGLGETFNNLFSIDGDGKMAFALKKILGWFGVQAPINSSYTTAEILLLLATAEGNSFEGLINTLKALDMQTNITLNNGCGCDGDCDCESEEKTISLDDISCDEGDDQVIDV